MKLNIEVFENGSFQIEAENIKIDDCFPGIDDQPLRPIRVKVTKSERVQEIVYALVDGVVTLRISEAVDGFSIQSRISFFKNSPHWFYPVFSAKIHGTEGIYRQRYGMGGPSGYVDLDKMKEKPNSYGLIALKKHSQCIFIYGTQHKHFLNQYEVHAIQKEMYEEDCLKVLGLLYST